MRFSFALRRDVLAAAVVVFSISCNAGDYEVAPAICTNMEICGNGIDDDCNGKVDDYDKCSCAPVGSIRTKTPTYNITNGISFLQPSICSLGVETCKNVAGQLLWVETTAPIGPNTASGSESSCNFKDDDCDGSVDEDATDSVGRAVGSDCFAGVGYCKLKGRVQCTANSQIPLCSAAARSALVAYYSIPYVDPEKGVIDYDYDCNGSLTKMVCPIDPISDTGMVTSLTGCSTDSAFSANTKTSANGCNGCPTGGSYALYSTLPKLDCGARIAVANCSIVNGACALTTYTNYTVFCK